MVLVEEEGGGGGLSFGFRSFRLWAFCLLPGWLFCVFDDCRKVYV